MGGERKIIEPRTLKGFRDFLPEMMIPREELIARVSKVYRSYGYSPIDTPVLEYLEILSGKGSDETDRQLYRFKDHGGREVGMRFDLTVPFARFSAQHSSELVLPFKRYHIAKVWRGENTQAGRYREFSQCDFDVVGSTSPLSDVETAFVVNDIMEKVDLRGDGAFTRFKIHLNSRKILNGLLEKIGLSEQAVPVLRALDKLAKIGRAKVAEEMAQTAGATEEQSNSILDTVTLAGTGSDPMALLDQLAARLAGNELGLEGIDVLRQIFESAKAVGIPEDRFLLDVSIARGLDYYTGTIFETFLDDLPSLGSVASGGRYDNLAALYTKETLPGIGASLGIDRLFAGLEELGMIDRVASPVKVFIPYFDKALGATYLKIAADLRRQGIGAEVYPDPKKLGAQLKYADRKGFVAAIIVGSGELERNVAQVKNLKAQTKEDISLADGARELAEYLEKTIG